jgi:hypothetical protein
VAGATPSVETSSRGGPPPCHALQRHSPDPLVALAGVMRLTGLAVLVLLISGGPARAGDAVDCSERFPVGRFALTQKEAAPLTAQLTGFSLVHIFKKSVPMRSSGPEDPCEFVYGLDVFEFIGVTTPGALVPLCQYA